MYTIINIIISLLVLIIGFGSIILYYSLKKKNKIKNKILKFISHFYFFMLYFILSGAVGFFLSNAGFRDYESAFLFLFVIIAERALIICLDKISSIIEKKTTNENSAE